MSGGRVDGIRDWLGGLSRRELVLLSILGLAVAGGAGLWYLRSLPRDVEIRAVPQPAPSVASPSPAVLLVHVAGWVERPGVYELTEGSRVVDAIEMAGGARRGADLGSVNLAALLTDGQQLVIPRPGEAAPAAPAPVVSPGGSVINVNTATAAELEALPGIGEVLAGAIVAYREEHGPFASVDQLVDVSGIGESTLEEIRDHVTV